MHFTLLHHKTLLLNQKQMSFKMSGSIKNEHTQKKIHYVQLFSNIRSLYGSVLWAAGSLIWSKEKQPKQINSKHDLKNKNKKTQEFLVCIRSTDPII